MPSISCNLKSFIFFFKLKSVQLNLGVLWVNGIFVRVYTLNKRIKSLCLPSWVIFNSHRPSKKGLVGFIANLLDILYFLTLKQGISFFNHSHNSLSLMRTQTVNTFLVLLQLTFSDWSMSVERMLNCNESVRLDLSANDLLYWSRAFFIR